MKFLGVPSSGSIAGTTSSHNRAGQYTRNRRSPVQPVGTGRRAFIRSSFSAASKAWQALSAVNQAAWTSYAASHPITDALGQSVTLTGHQMFVSCSVSLLNCGAALPTTPPASAAVSSAGVPLFTAVHAGAITVTPAGGGVATDYLLYAFSAPVSAGVSFMKTFWQAGHVAANSVTAIVATTVYTAQFGAIQTGQKIFLKVTPVNQYGVSGTPNIISAIVTQLTSAAVLVFMGSSMHLTIGTQSGTADHYQLDKSADNVTWTNNVGTVAYGVGNFVVPTVGYYYRITGVDSGGVPLTLVSNSQQVPY